MIAADDLYSPGDLLQGGVVEDRFQDAQSVKEGSRLFRTYAPLALANQ